MDLVKRGDRVLVPGFVLDVAGSVVMVEFAGTYPDNGQRICIAAEALKAPEFPADPAFTAPPSWLRLFRGEWDK